MQSVSVVAQEEKLDYVFSSIYSLYTVLGTILNSILLFLIICLKQEAIERRYRLLLGNTTCTLLSLAVLTFFLQLRFVMAGDSMAYVSLGPARFLDSPRLSLFATSLLLVTDIYSFMTIAMCMVYKYVTVTGGSPSAKRILSLIGLFYLLPLSTGAALMLYNPDFTVLYKTIESVHPEYNIQRYGKYSGLPDVKNYFVMYFLVVVCLIGVASYVVMIVAGLKIRRYALSFHSTMSPKNTKIFNMLVKALVIQSCMPIFFSFPTKFLYFLMQFGVFESLTAEYLVFAMSPMLAVVDPCVTMYYVLPYRNYILKKLRLSKGKESALRIDALPSASLPTRSVHFTAETM